MNVPKLSVFFYNSLLPNGSSFFFIGSIIRRSLVSDALSTRSILGNGVYVIYQNMHLWSSCWTLSQHLSLSLPGGRLFASIFYKSWWTILSGGMRSYHLSGLDLIVPIILGGWYSVWSSWYILVLHSLPYFFIYISLVILTFV